MNIDELEKELDDIEYLSCKIAAEIEVCANSCAYEDNPVEEVLRDAKEKQENLIYKIFKLQTKYVYTDKLKDKNFIIFNKERK